MATITDLIIVLASLIIIGDLAKKHMEALPGETRIALLAPTGSLGAIGVCVMLACSGKRWLVGVLAVAAILSALVHLLPA